MNAESAAKLVSDERIRQLTILADKLDVDMDSERSANLAPHKLARIKGRYDGHTDPEMRIRKAADWLRDYATLIERHATPQTQATHGEGEAVVCCVVGCMRTAGTMCGRQLKYCDEHLSIHTMLETHHDHDPPMTAAPVLDAAQFPKLESLGNHHVHAAAPKTHDSLGHPFGCSDSFSKFDELGKELERTHLKEMAAARQWVRDKFGQPTAAPALGDKELCALIKGLSEGADLINEIPIIIGPAISDYMRQAAAALSGVAAQRDGEARVSEDARDAMRYRWLKSQSVSRRGEERPILVTPVAFHQNDWDGQIDRYIDAVLGVADQEGKVA